MPGFKGDILHSEADTQSASSHWSERVEARVPTLTLLSHPERQRIGERALLASLPAGREVLLSRHEPGFAHPGERREQPLADLKISRSPLRLTARPGDREHGGVDWIRLDSRGTATVAEVDGSVLRGQIEIDSERLERGVVLCLSRRLVLLLHFADPLIHGDLPSFGLIGASDAIGQVRAEIQRLAPLEVPVLLRGETGTGKELAATALHRGGRRANAPFVAVNMAAIPPSLAGAELFGAVKGAYTGATRGRRGAFRRADGGTLFLDEIGDTPEEIQALLLRSLESREVLPVGGERAIPIDVRLITATDLDLEAAIASGRFRSPLLYRVAGYEIELPPLRQRREDIGRLFYHFLERELEAMGGTWPEGATGASPWPPAEVVARLAMRPWPGNVRQLRNAARQLAILGPEASAGQLSRWLESAGVSQRSSSSSHDAPGADAPPPRRSRPAEISEDELLEVLRACRYRVVDAAERLGISRAAVYKLMDSSPRIRKASDLEHAEIVETLEQCGGDLTAMVECLEVSAPALRRRMRQLGFD